MNVAITYLIKDNNILLLFKKTRNYYVGPGGKQDKHEQILQTATREFKEETGLDISPKLAAVSAIRLDEAGGKKEYTLSSFYATDFEGELLERTPEGILSWQPSGQIQNLSMFAGDKILLKLLLEQIKQDEKIETRYASFVYKDNYKKLVSYSIDGDENNA
ncbi:hypothetical protein AwErysi_04450 [Erysipelotrichaceae bacterium]|nr:hypothetical protein AwErysi_04450 [Erysipelotrichaceae bacterium]